MENWHDDPKIIALITMWKFGLHFSYPDIVQKLRKMGIDTTKNALEKRIANWGINKEYESHFIDSASHEELRDRMVKRLDQYFGIPESKIKPPKKSTGSIQLTLVTSDYHCPFHREDMVFDIIKRYGGKGLTLIINGDLFDQYSISRFVIYKPIQLKEEFSITYSVVELLAQHFAEIIITSGNHESRVFRFFAPKIGLDKMFLVNYDWPSYIASKIPNVKVASNIVGDKNSGEHNLSHYHILGKDCAVGHFELSGGGKTIMKAVQKMEEWARNWRVYTDELSQCRLFLQGHVHMLNKATIGGGMVTIGETGCMCGLQEYSLAPDAKYLPGINGWWEVWQEDGETDINKSNYILWEK